MPLLGIRLPGGSRHGCRGLRTEPGLVSSGDDTKRRDIVSTVTTYGRYPSLGEVAKYYRRDDVLDFLLEICSTRRVVVIIPAKRHWEPDWENDIVRVGTRKELGQFLADRIAAAFPDAATDRRPPFYPSLHLDLGRADHGRDGGLESDLPTWRASFHDVLTLIRELRREDVPHRLKYSGSRSLHVVIPHGGKRVLGRRFGDSRAHMLQIMRAPYSLNEDTGLVSLPLAWEDLPGFRPWQANMHLVRVRTEWLEEFTPEQLDRSRRFAADMRKRRHVARCAYFETDVVVDAARSACEAYRPMAPIPDTPRCDVEAAWMTLWGAEPMDVSSATKVLKGDGREAPWLTAEALLIHAESLPPDLLLALLATEEPLARAAAIELMLRFPRSVREHFVTALQVDDMVTQARQMVILAQSEVLRQEVISALREAAGPNPDVAIRLACVTGLVFKDWKGARRLVKEAEEQHGAGRTWPTRVEALRLMEQADGLWGRPVHRRIAAQLAELGEAVLDLLLLAYANTERRLRWLYLVALSYIPDSRAMDAFVQSLGDNYRDSVRLAMHGLLEIGAPALPALIEAAASDQSRLRRNAVNCLGKLGDVRGRDAVVAALEDSDAVVCRHACVAVRSFLDESDIGLLKRVVRERDNDTGMEAVQTLAMLGLPGEEAVRDLALTEQEPCAAGWVWRQGDPRGREILLGGLDRSPAKSESAIINLTRGEIDESLVDILIGYLHREEYRDDEEIALDALVRSGHEKAMDALIDIALHGRTRRDRMLATACLGGWDHPRSIAALVAQLSDPDKRIRLRAQKALMSIGENARPALAPLAEDMSRKPLRNTVIGVLRGIDFHTRLQSGERLNLSLLDAVDGALGAIKTLATELPDSHTEEDVQVLVHRLADRDRHKRWQGEHLLAAIGEEVRPMVEACLREDLGEEHRQALQRVLGRLDAEE